MNEATQTTTWYLRRDTAAMDGDSPTYDEIDPEKWFGPYADAVGPRAWEQLDKWIKRNFQGCHLARTPVQTALGLAEHSLPWERSGAPYEYLVVPEAEKTIIARHCTHGQHRYGDCGKPGETVHQIVLYDARIAHLSHIRSLPVLLQADHLIHDDGPYVPFRRGFYRTEVTVPPRWNHIGLVPFGGGFPSKPGTTFETWLSWREIDLLLRNQLCPWPFAVHERILFAPNNIPGLDPLRQFGEILSASLERLETLPRDETVRALRVALRAVALHLIGNMARGAREDPTYYESLDDLPLDLSPSAAISHEGDKYVVRQPQKLDLYHARWYRPEWAAEIWAATRVATTQKALLLKRDDLIAIDGDGLYLKSDPAWSDTGRVGCYRHQATWRGSLALPRHSSIGYPQRDLMRAVKTRREQRMQEVQ